MPNFIKYNIFQSIFILLMFVAHLSGFAQSTPVTITDWVNKPTADDMKKPLLFVDFWATWCLPCIHAMPRTDLLKKEFSDDVLFVYISDETTHKVSTFMREHDQHFYSAIDNSGSNYSNYNIKSLPHSVLLDDKGKLIWEGNPLELKKPILQKYINIHKDKRASLDRISLLSRPKYLKDNWAVFKTKNDSLQYLKKRSASDRYSVENGEYYFSGNIKFIISQAFNLPLKHIISETQLDKNYIIKSKSEDNEKFKKLLKLFLSKECRIEINKIYKYVDAYILDIVDVGHFMNINSFDFEMGNKGFLADDMNVKIDNASISEMAIILSNLSENQFVYTGKNMDRYDWDIHYKFNNLTLEQLESELGFRLKNDTVKMEFLQLSYPKTE